MGENSAQRDFELLQAWRDGDKQSGDQLFDAHFGSVHRFFLNKVDQATAEDLTQATFMGCVQGRDRFASQSSFRTYLFSIARNQIFMHFRKRGRQDNLIEFKSVSVADLGASPKTLTEAKEEQLLLLRALRKLPVDFQIAVELYYWEGLSTAELAEVLEVPAGTVRSRLARAREHLAKHIEELAQSPEHHRSTMHGFEDWARSLKNMLD